MVAGGRLRGAARWRPLLTLVAALGLAGCGAQGPLASEAWPVRPPPYAAVMRPVPAGQDRIHLLARIPGRMVVREDCVLFATIGDAVVLPVFENGTAAGRDRDGPFVYDPVSRHHFRDGARVVAGGGGGETLAELQRRNAVQRAVPERCAAALTEDRAMVLNPGIEPADRGG